MKEKIEDIEKIEDVKKLEELSKKYKNKTILWAILSVAFWGVFIVTLHYLADNAGKLTELHRDLVACGITIPSFAISTGFADVAGINNNDRRRANSRIKKLKGE